MFGMRKMSRRIDELTERVREFDFIQSRHNTYHDMYLTHPSETIIRHEPLPSPVNGQLVFTHAPTGKRITASIYCNRVNGEISIVSYTPLPREWQASDLIVDMRLIWPTP